MKSTERSLTEFHFGFGGEQYVSGLEIAVDHMARVEEEEPLADLVTDVADLRFGQRLLQLDHQLVDGATRAELQKNLSIERSFSEDRENGTEIETASAYTQRWQL